jgi:two-component system sensor histidine kinase BaeS
MNGYRLVLSDGAGIPVTSPGSLPPARASANVVVDGRPVGKVTVGPVHGQVLTSEDRALHNRLDEGYLISGGIAIVLGLVAAALMAPALARPVWRLTEAARRMQRGDLGARVNARGASELRELGRVFNRLAETLEHEEQIRRDAAADIAHELRTPLAGIVSRIERPITHGGVGDSARHDRWPALALADDGFTALPIRT